MFSRPVMVANVQIMSRIVGGSELDQRQSNVKVS